MSCADRTSRDYLVIKLSGEYDVTRQAALAKELDVDPSRGIVILDLSEVIYLDSIALGMLRSFQDRVRARQGSFRIVAQRDHVKRILQIVGLDKTADIFASIDEAAKFKPSQEG